MKKYYYAGRERIGMRTGSTVNYILGDHLTLAGCCASSTSVTTSSTGVYQSETLYKPWGEMRYNSGSLPTKYTYTGQYSNVADFGLMNYNARWYDPALGRFAQADTLIPQPSDPQAWDRYAYVENNPLRYTDPSGHFTEEAIRQYLLKYYGDEELALRTLQLWKQDRAWWEMLSLAEGGDHLLGYQWFISGNPSRPTGGDSKQFNAVFAGEGQGDLAGLEGLDCVAVQSGTVVEMGQRWNVEWQGIYRQREQEAPAFETKEGVDWYTVVRKPGWAQRSKDLLSSVGIAIETLMLMRIGGSPVTSLGLSVAQEYFLSHNNTSIGTLAVDALDWEENDIQVHIGGVCGVHLNFQEIDGQYHLER